MIHRPVVVIKRRETPTRAMDQGLETDVSLQTGNGIICKQCKRQRPCVRPFPHSPSISRLKTHRTTLFSSDVLTVTLCAMLLWLPPPTTCQGQSEGQPIGDLRPFPTPENVAKERPILTLPAASTCGFPSKMAYCESLASSSSVEICSQRFCDPTCGDLSRSQLPGYDNLLIATSAGFTSCVGADTINVRPGSVGAQFATAITAPGDNCFLSSDLAPSAGLNGSFTVTAWLWIGQATPGTLLEKSTASGESILQIVVNPDGITIFFNTQTGQQTASQSYSIGQQNWTHVAVQVFGKSVSFFINGLRDDYTSTGTFFVSDVISDAPGSFRLGQNANGTGQFIGKFQDIRYYSTTLSNREIQEVYSGVLPAVRLQNNCRCPAATPRLKPQDVRYCVSNGVPDNAGDATLRISEYSHPLEYINDENVNTVWISTFLNEITLEVDLGDQFEVFHVAMEFYSPLPKAIVIERLFDGSDGYQPWQYYAENCTFYFGMENNGAITAEDGITCIQMGTPSFPVSYSKDIVMFTVVSTDRPGFTDYYNNPTIQQFVQASRVRVRFVDHFFVNNIRHEYYAVYELRVNGRCGCNGHAATCITDRLPYQCLCSEESHTQGIRCDECQPLYNNKPFRQGSLKDAYNCQYCECYNHSDSCVYNATLDPFPSSWTEGGGGVCFNCRDNTAGQNCETCLDGFFRSLGKSLSDADVCTPCLCDPAGTVLGQMVCDKTGGQCPCKSNVTGRTCSECQPGFYNLQALDPDGCTPCQCHRAGTVNGDITCDQLTANCYCKKNVRGKQCTECQYGFYNLIEDDPDGCTACNCNPFGSLDRECNPAGGQCQCKPHVQGVKCDQCMDGFYNFTGGCFPCNCNTTGIIAGTTCDKDTGQCVCKSLTAGRQCNQCKLGSSSFGNSPESGCERCYCDPAGVADGKIDCARGCLCKANVDGTFCQKCKDNFWNLTAENVLGCESCNCDPTGVNSAVSCDGVTGACSCLKNRVGRRCDDCVLGFFKSSVEQGGCLDCGCDPDGQMPGTQCDTQTGKCSCQESNGVGGDKCDECLPGFYGFAAGKCKACNCLPAGSVNNVCVGPDGLCECKVNVMGETCDKCVPGASHMDILNPFGCSKTPFQQPSPIHTPLSPTSMNISWSAPDYPNGVILKYTLYRNGTQLYEGEGKHYLDMNLKPYTWYSYAVKATNSHGSVTSPLVTFRTNPGTPSSDIELQVREIQVASAFFSWNAPSAPNGPLQKYQLVSYHDDTESLEWEGLATEAVLTSLAPYQSYNLTVRACTAGGCSESEGVIFVTKPAPPANMQPPIITAISSTQLLVRWSPPLNPNGIILYYELWMRGLEGPGGMRDPLEQRIFNPSGLYDPLNPGQSIMEAPATSYNVTQLQPFTVYEFQVLAQNEAGRAASLWTEGRTQETLPAFMPAPAVVGVSSTELSVRWSSPTVRDARGNITLYRLYQNFDRNLTADPFASPTFWKLINATDGLARSLVVGGLVPYTKYDFKVEACNSRGCINSTASSGRTLIAAPEGMEMPAVDSYNSTVMEISWRPPISPNGPTPMYTVQKTNIALSYPASVVRGTRFPGGGYYAFPADTIPQSVDFTGIRFEFRLSKPSGLLMFAASENQQEFIAVVFKDGRPRLMYDTQGDCETDVVVNVTLPENVNLTTLVDNQVHTVQAMRQIDGGSILVDGIYSGLCKRTFPGVTTYDDEGLRYDGGEWHSFEAIRRGIVGTVIVDRKWTGTGWIRDKVCQESSIIGPTGELYVGGVPNDFILRRSESKNRVLAAVIDKSFQGCIHKVEVLKQMHPFEVWEELDWTTAVSYELAFLNWQGCPINLGIGVHFMGKGYLAVPYSEIPGCQNDECDGEIEITFEMRTSLHTGVLFIMHGGAGIYLLAYMQNGNVVFEFNNGPNSADKVQVIYTHDDPAQPLCNGDWHKFVFNKTQGEGSISVDGKPRSVAGNPAVIKTVPFRSDMYVGGIKPDSDVSRFLENNGNIVIPSEGFGGCIAGLNVNGGMVVVLSVRDLVNINLDGCPPFFLPKTTCEDGLVTDVYSGYDSTAYDYALLPYTDYIYRVLAKNSLGEASSPWGYGRTREGAPVGVGPPTGVRPISGYMVEVEWEEPQSTSGLLTKTIITAYNLDVPDRTPISEEVLDVNIEAINITELTPNTNYSFKISACTSGGCTESMEGVSVITPVEAPEDVAEPSATEATATTLLVSWKSPSKPNGNITGYLLYQDGIEIYAGGEEQFLATELRVYTSYQFFVRACTIVGCNSGPSVPLTTAQMPPTEVKPPVLNVRDAERIEVAWEEPSELNGVLERYLVYFSTVEGEEGEVVHNSTIFFPSHTVENLLPGTTYFVSVGVCTGGGCTVSNASQATTEESSPSGIAAPVVTSPSPTQLVITWTPPQFPNGQVISYNLYHNSLRVTQGVTFSHQLDDLLPYSLNTFRLEVCTAQGCGRSAEVEARTQEARPVGSVVLQVSVEDARTVSVNWTRPEAANGLLFFNVFFEGSFYTDPDNWDYTVVVERRSLLQETVSYTTLDVGPLIPLADYNVQVNASNSKGFIMSNVVPITMPAGSPDGVRPPRVESDSPRSMMVFWDPAGRANTLEGEVSYLVQFRQQEGDIIKDVFGPSTTLAYRMEDLAPFTSYQFRLVASSLGTTTSDWVSNFTQQDKPSGVIPPRIATVEARSILLEWVAPQSPNGIITSYSLFQNGQLTVEIAGNRTQYTVEELVPYTQYSFQLEACTVAGCTLSVSSSSARTQHAVADGISPPLLKVLTPAMIEVMWSEPLGPNGIIEKYIIERRQVGGADVSIVGEFLPTADKKYIDESPELSPFTTYGYRLKVVNGAGASAGPWANVTTSSSRPAGVMPPALTVLTPRSIRVSWMEPLQSNGIIEYYLLKWGNSRREIRDFTVLTVVLEDLVPYTEYSISVAACTSGGCTESSPSTATTLPTIPSGQAPPTATAISQSAISVSWQPPSGPNGPNIRYELARRKIRQPLLPSQSVKDEYQSIYLGTSLFFEDRSLPMFTTYVYRLTIFNDVGQSLSNDSKEVTTFGGFPRKPANISVTVLSHQEILVNWTLPDPADLQGDVEFLNLTADAKGIVLMENPAVGSRTYTLSNLLPSTEYTIRLQVTIFGGASITSQPVTVSTFDGAPEKIPAPVLSVVSNTALRVTWMAPLQPNGEITAYNVIVDGETVPTGFTQPGSLVVGNLQPYTVYEIQTEACTIFKCSRSESTFGTTAEALPLGVAAPVLNPVNATSVQVQWEVPSGPNGIILRYEVWRQAMQNCSEIVSPEVNPEDSKCTYFECSVLEKMCGTTCYTGAKVCCAGTVYDIQSGYDCCDGSYLLKPGADAVCCGGKFYQPQTSYACCGKRYLELLPGEICCQSPVEDRVSVGRGDNCCAGVPYSSTGSQLCCGDMLVDRYQRQCCGGDLVTEGFVCCGNSTVGQVYTPQSGYTCCGHVYLAAAASLCCSSDTGHTKVHYYSSALEKASANEVCCGLEKISKGLSCCNYRGYNPATQTCADQSSQITGCGTGVVCPITQAATAQCNRCDFDSRTTVCGSIPGHVTAPLPAPSNNSSCSTDEEKIYMGLEFALTDGGLLPFSKYQYSMRVVNSAGATSSPYAEAQTLPAPPEHVSPPTARINPEQLFIIYLTWSEPQQPNGEIIRYILMRDGVELYRGLDEQFTDVGNVLPYKIYTYMLTACTIAGCTDSPAVKVSTAQGIPEAIPAPAVTVLSPTSLQIVILPPGQPNGDILQYTVLIAGRVEKYSVTTPQDILVESLEPYTQYSVSVEVCTAVGCAFSPNMTVTTAEATPQGVDPPSVVVMTATSVAVYWKPPAAVNGQLQAYSLILRDIATDRLIYSGLDLSFTAQDLIPGRTYNFVLDVSTNGGSTRSAPTRIVMPSKTPLNVPPPHTVSVLSATQIYVSWDEVVSAEGEIGQYRVLLNTGQETESTTGVGTALSITLSGLQPYTEYQVRLQACLLGIFNGCGTSEAAVNRTYEAPPFGQTPPTLTALSSDTVEIEWKEPTSPNGEILFYRIFQRANNLPGSELLINQVRGDVFDFKHSGRDLKPYTVYQFGIMALNSVGQTEVRYAEVRMLEYTPSGLSPPQVTDTGAYSFSLTWNPPEEPNGVISKYVVYYKIAGSNVQSSVTVAGNVTVTAVSGLEPFSQYLVQLEAVNGDGSVRSDEFLITTKEASPSGLKPFSVEKIDTGNAVILSWEPPLKPNGKVTVYRVYDMSDEDNSIYIGSAQVFEFRRLQPFTSYTIKLEVCTAAGCTLGEAQEFTTAEIAPSAQSIPTLGTVTSNTAVIRWIPPLSANGQITKFEVFRRTRALRRKRQAAGSGFDGEVVYETPDTGAESYEYTDSGLEPYTHYEYKVRASNSKGFTDSPWQTVRTSQAAPEGMAAPLVSYVADEVTSLNMSWQPPTSPNGILQSYRLRRNDSIPFSLPTDGPLVYVYSNLLPYTVYSFTVTVCSGGGCTESDATLIRTKEAAPLSVAPPSLSPVDSTTIRANWSIPQITNGVINLYKLSMDGVVVYEGLDMEFSATDLVPFEEYSFFLIACTQGGCSQSPVVVGRPDDSVPTDMDPPLLRVVSSTAIEISWSAPQNPNGVILSYDVRRDGNLIFTDSTTPDGVLSTAFTDYELQPGEEYSYTVIARNRKGSVESPPSKARTYSTSPTGLEPPALKPLSSTSIEAKWVAPVNPNGAIVNYTLYLGNDIAYSGSADQLIYVVPGLNFYQQYTFRLQACTRRGCELSQPVTARTQEAAPQQLDAPSVTALASASGAHRAVQITWRPPLKPNGVVLYYQLQRKIVVQTEAGTNFGDVILVYNGTELEHVDADPRVLPFQRYQYMVIAINGAGKANSPWADVTTKQSPPTSVDPPEVVGSTATTITVKLTVPVEPNGVIRLYNVLIDGVVQASSLMPQLTAGETIPLDPFTTYTLTAQACTAGGCTNSTGIIASTAAAKPAGLKPVTVVSVGNSTAVLLTWDFPSKPNGEISRFLVYQRSACPPPSQPFVEVCLTGNAVLAYEGIGTTTGVGGLSPYSAYQFMLQAENEVGQTDFPSWVRAVTAQAAPVYVNPPKLRRNGTLAVVDWTDSFVLNGRLREYLLRADGMLVMRGLDSAHSIQRTSKDAKINLEVEVVTDVGQAVSPLVIFDPNAVDNVGTTEPPVVTTAAPLSAKPWYEEIWFIIVIVIIALLLLFIIFALCLRRTGPKEPYIRERMPLPAETQKPPQNLYVIDANDGSVIDVALSPSGVSGRSTMYQGPGVGILNPAFDSSLPRLQTLSIDPGSKSSLKGLDDDDDFDEITWDKNFDSGLFDDDDDGDSLNNPAYSYTREQTVFTDTHL